jgi:hypothetical protein
VRCGERWTNHEEIRSLRDFSADAKELEEVEELAVDVATYLSAPHHGREGREETRQLHVHREKARVDAKEEMKDQQQQLPVFSISCCYVTFP